MTHSAFGRTQEACVGRDILAVQDTTVTRSSGVGGDYLHAMIAVDAHDGTVLGPIDAVFLERTSGKKAERHIRSAQDKESHRWLAATERAGQITGATRVTMVADREADIFDLLARRPTHVDLIVRANHNRVLEDNTRVVQQIATMPRLGYTELTRPRIPGRAMRTATLSVRFGRMAIKPPKQMEKSELSSVHLTYVDLREESPPAGAKPVHWRLLTTYEINTVEDALGVAGRYAKRWTIEELFRTMKRKGFDIEGLRIADNAPETASSWLA